MGVVEDDYQCEDVYYCCCLLNIGLVPR